MINRTKEDYLRTIYHLSEEHQKNEVSSVHLCKCLKVSKSSVSEMLRKLIRDHLVKDFFYGKIKLTAKGKKESLKVTKKHRIIELFLSEILRLDQNLIHEEAHKLEHAFCDESISKINKLLKNPKSCPHGKPIPKIIK
ncbi:MAG: metal-dependent transcriptional regulator [Candidatus Woesearchaeota archaeon]|jgi:DtxR family Mn-dependent transcriptional regulator|nr:metal-dependent transcriptional regulator [Candidatus Woesearchaeota archaeon]MDP6265370.1 metal-dependent transcriptional regulator [Candidatus Woesearchaeota archaeon]|tara:strand:- start:712 stop:1125 length:414 start_codon:yes stop_codon:yes gene_type:complete